MKYKVWFGANIGSGPFLYLQKKEPHIIEEREFNKLKHLITDFCKVVSGEGPSKKDEEKELASLIKKQTMNSKKGKRISRKK